MGEHAIEAQGLVKRFGDFTALDGVDLAARPGTVLGVLGPNGAGKTTSVRILATLSRPTGGRAFVGGHDVVRQAAKVRSLIGLTGQYAGVDEMLTGTENLQFIGRLLGMSRPDSRRRAEELLKSFGLADAASKPARTYSGGMRRRLDLAASLVGDPEILFLDEPTTGLDPRARGELWDVVRMLVADGTTVLLTTQYLEEADQLADDIVVIDHGKVIARGTPTELKSLVGGYSLRLQPEDAADLDRLAEAVAASRAGTEPARDDRAVTVGIMDERQWRQIAASVHDQGISLSEFHLGLSSLDEVFLTLTGHHAEPSRNPSDEHPEPEEAEQP